jgi:hypothetical protein
MDENRRTEKTVRFRIHEADQDVFDAGWAMTTTAATAASPRVAGVVGVAGVAGVVGVVRGVWAVLSIRDGQLSGTRRGLPRRQADDEGPPFGIISPQEGLGSGGGNEAVDEGGRDRPGRVGGVVGRGKGRGVRRGVRGSMRRGGNGSMYGREGGGGCGG